MSILNPPASIGVALGTSALVIAIYQKGLPSIPDIRVADAQNRDIEAAERSATWTAAAIVSAVSLLAKDGTIFIIGGATIVAMAWWHRHADLVVPSSGKAVPLTVVPPPSDTQMDNPDDYGYANGL